MIVRIYRLRWSIVRENSQLSSQFADCDHNPKNYGHNFQVVIKISGFAIPIPRLGTKSQNCDHKSRIAINIPGIAATIRRWWPKTYSAASEGSVSTLVEKWKTRHHPALRRKPNKPPGRAALEDDAMDNDNKKRELKEAFGPDTIEQFMRDEIRGKLEKLIEEEVRQALGVGRDERNGEERRGYLNVTRPRTLTTSLGPTAFAMPRARLKTEDGGTTEWSSRVVRRYQRRTLRVDEAILGVYLSGGNTRRIRGALAPLLKGGPLSKDAVSRLVGRMREDFNEWRERDLADEDIRYVYFDGWYPKVRIGKKRERVPVLVALGVRANGYRVLLDMCIAGDESCASWNELIERLQKRHMKAPILAIIDGNPGLESALGKAWPRIDIQRCTAHKLRNLQAKAPARLREELAEDYRRMMYAENQQAAEQHRQRFTKKW